MHRQNKKGITMLHDDIDTFQNESLADMGDGDIAYIREVRSEDVKDLFPNAPNMAGGIKLWALVSADGSPIMLADTRAAVIANAHEAELPETAPACRQRR